MGIATHPRRFSTSCFTRKTTTESDDVALNIAIWSGYSGRFPPPDLELVDSGTHNATSQTGVTQELRLQSADPNGDIRREYTDEEMLQGIYKRELIFAPGTRWNYSNNGYVTLGILVRRITGE